MKLIIDIPDDVHNKISEIYNSCEELHTRGNLYQTIANGKPYEERPQGQWNYIQAGMCVCPFCGAYPHKEYKNFCAKCGAGMRGKEE